MNHSIITADRTTHLKIVVVALISATVVAGVGIAARISHYDSGARTGHIRAEVPVIKAGEPVVVSDSKTIAVN
jgi:hypothetical protein